MSTTGRPEGLYRSAQHEGTSASAIVADSGRVADATTLSFGLMRVGGRLLALRIETLREVIACPAALDPLPMPVPGLCGAVRLRGNIIPVLDLSALLGPTHGPAPDRPAAIQSVIVLMRCGEGLLGLRVDAVQGMAEVARGMLRELSYVSPTEGGIVTHTFEVDGGVAAVLDAVRIAALPGVPMVAEPSVAALAGGVGRREPMLLFDCGGIPLGIAASSVDATVPCSVFRHSSLVDRLCRGVVDHHGHEVPVIDTLYLLGLGRGAAAATESALIVLRFPQGLLALMLDEVKDIASVGPDDILPLPPLGLTEGRLFCGMLGPLAGSGAHASPLLLDAAALHREAALAGLASLSRLNPLGGSAQDAARTDGAAQAPAGSPYLTYLVEVETASPLVHAAEIIDFPRSGVVSLSEHRDATLGLVVHRGAALPLVCLSSLLGRPITLDPASAQVLIVEADRRRIGFVVQALCSIEIALWEQPDAPGSPAVPRHGLQPLIEIGTGAQRRTLPRLDLLRLARTLLGEKKTVENEKAVGTGSGERDRPERREARRSAEDRVLPIS